MATHLNPSNTPFLVRSRRLAQRAMLKFGIWVTPLDAFRRAIAETYYRTGGFSFVQIGANDGVSFDDFYWLVKKFSGRGLVVEPLQDAFERLSHNYRPFSAVTAIRSAVHPSADTLTLHRVKPDSLSQVPAWAFGSASASPEWLGRQGIADAHVEHEIVPARHLMRLLSDYHIRELDVLQIDVEGFDHDVIRMLDFETLSPRIIKYEMMQDHEPDATAKEAEMSSFLRTKGYSIHRVGMDAIALLSRR